MDFRGLDGHLNSDSSAASNRSNTEVARSSSYAQRSNRQSNVSRKCRGCKRYFYARTVPGTRYPVPGCVSRVSRGPRGPTVCSPPSSPPVTGTGDPPGVSEGWTRPGRLGRSRGCRGHGQRLVVEVETWKWTRQGGRTYREG